MASPFVHLAIAHLVEPQVPLGQGERPPFLFGSIAPDLDKLGLCSREASHFWSFSEDVSGALKLLRAHPHLAAARLSPAERAFVAGYLCHLVADEQWMLTIYRPFFGRHSPYGGSREGAELQWALHALLEQRQLEEAPHIHDLVAALARSRAVSLRPDVLPFIPMAALDTWRDNVLGQARLVPGAERGRHLHAGRHGSGAPAGEARPVNDDAWRERFFAQLPYLFSKASEYVPGAALGEFERRAVEASVTLLGDYLAGRPLQPPPGTLPLTSPGT